MKPYYETPLGKLYHGDCLDIMPQLEPVDLVLTDPPYGTTACLWDSIIPIEEMWGCLKQNLNNNAVIILTATEPFASILRTSNLNLYKYDWVWVKEKGNGVGTAKYQPLRKYECVLVFYKKNKYFPIMEKLEKPYKHIITSKNSEQKKWGFKSIKEGELYYKEYTHRFPVNVLEIPREHNTKNLHPTQKPTALMEYLIRTYTKKNDIVEDFSIGSGTTAVACERLKRRWIGIEIEEKYCEIAAKRIEQERKQLKMF